MTPNCTMRFTVAWRANGNWLDSSYNLVQNVLAAETPMPWHKTELYFFSPPEKGAILVFQAGFTKAASGTLWIDDETVEAMNYTPEETAEFQKLDFSKVVYRENFNRPGFMYKTDGPDKAKCFRDETGGRGGTPCLGAESPRGSLVRFIPLKTPGKYRISGFCRGAAAKVTAAFQNENKWMSPEYTVNTHSPASPDWQEFVLYVNRPEGNDVRVALKLSAADYSGKVWFDDIDIATVKEADK